MIEVKVRSKIHGAESIITYQAYKDTQYLFDLIGQVDSNGNLVEGDPNLLPEHKRKSASVTVAEVRQQPKPEPVIPESLRAEFEKKKAELAAKQAPIPPPIPEQTEIPSKPTEIPSERKKRPYNKRKVEV